MSLAFVLHTARLMRRKACLQYHIFPDYLINGTIFRKKIIEHKMCLHFLYNFCLKHFSFSEKFSKVLSHMYERLHVKHQLFLWDDNETWFSSTDSGKILEYQIQWKSVQWKPSCSMRADGETDRQTEMTNLTVTFRNFADKPQNLT